jgi:predicted transcriptional regulator
MLESIATKGYVKKENMTPKQFYDNLQWLKAAALVRRELTIKPKYREHDGNYYEITSLGKLVYLAIKDIRKATARYAALRA